MTALAEGLDHLVVAVSGAGAIAPWSKLGLRLTDSRPHAGLGTASSVLFVGEGQRQSYVEFIALTDGREAATSGARASLLATLDAGRALYRLSFRTANAQAAAQQLGPLSGEPYEVRRGDGSLVGTVVPIREDAGLGCDVSLIQYAPDLAERRAARAPYLAHELPLRRLDHVAIVSPDLAGSAQRWKEVLGLEVVGELRGNGMHILQVEAGDVIVELLGADGPESPIAARPAGLVSMAAFEVPDVHAAARNASAAGFTVSEPRAGIIPRSTVATISGDQLAGLGLQLLSYTS